MLKLFRDFVFHQVDENGAPYLDLAHIITSLNKVEAGSMEKVGGSPFRTGFCLSTLGVSLNDFKLLCYRPIRAGLAYFPGRMLFQD